MAEDLEELAEADPAPTRSKRRRKLDPDVRLKVWVRSGGRCVICNTYLLEGGLTGREVTFGEVAHIVGQKKSANSPRGLENLDETLRDHPDNLVLICEDEHDEVDKRGTRDLFSVDGLQRLKREHEERIYHVTSFSEQRATVPLRVVARLRGNAVSIDRDAAATAVIRGADRFPRFRLGYRNSIEIDLTALPGEQDAGPDYYGHATQAIDEVLDHRYKEGVESGDIRHLSVFAWARLPLLIYLGSRLDDNVPTGIYQRHRSTETWEWPDPDGDVSFKIDIPEGGDAAEGVLVMNVSGTIKPSELPTEVADLPRVTLTVDGTPEPDIFTGPRAVESFTSASREVLSRLEATNKQIRTLHVFAAIPLSAAVAFGRVLDHPHPDAVIYDRSAHNYQPAITLRHP